MAEQSGKLGIPRALGLQILVAFFLGHDRIVAVARIQFVDVGRSFRRGMAQLGTEQLAQLGRGPQAIAVQAERPVLEFGVFRIP
ncbi:hypothetical protein D3C81_1609110 [compost metagenome]